MTDISHYTIKQLVVALRRASPYSTTPDLLTEAADRLDPMQEYTRTAAHPVTVEMLLRIDSLLKHGFYPSEAEDELTKIRAAIAQIEAMK